jgi:cytochrome c biogenesis protein CcdA
MLWMVGAFVFCPCHLPITLSALALMLGGTAAGALLRAHPYVAGVIVTALWAAGTWRGLTLVKRARSFVEHT